MSPPVIVIPKVLMRADVLKAESMIKAMQDAPQLF